MFKDTILHKKSPRIKPGAFFLLCDWVSNRIINVTINILVCEQPGAEIHNYGEMDRWKKNIIIVCKQTPLRNCGEVSYFIFSANYLPLVKDKGTSILILKLRPIL